MILPFYKYQGAGNDFILIDNRKTIFDAHNLALVKKLCDRKFGIGADGLMLLQEKNGYDFELIFFNPDGSKSLCGNGSRCMVAFAKELGLVKSAASFVAFDGEHQAHFLSNGWISLQMNDVSEVENGNDYFFLNTGSPHYVKMVKNLAEYEVYEEGRKIRYSNRFAKVGTNVNFIEKINDTLHIRTYERGVENETLACGTGVTAAALVAAIAGIATDDTHCKIKAMGGELNVKFKQTGANSFTDIFLEGPATFVFKGEIVI